MKMKRKTRKFADGGFSTAEGENKNISDDVRARALRSVMPDDSPAGTTGYGEQNDLPETKTVTKTKTSVTASKPKADESSEKERIESIGKKQALEKVSPELDIMPAAKLAAGAGALYAGARAIGKRVLASRAAEKTAEETAKKAAINAEMKAASDKAAKTQATRAANKARRSEEGFNPAEALKARKKAGMKAGGSVKSSASRRADGCAIRGNTRA
jgi:hypothetical protein